MAYPMQRRWMMFVDGENFTIRGQEFASATGLKLSEGPYWKRDVFLWFPDLRGRQTSLMTGQVGRDVSQTAVRAHYYTSVSGDEKLLHETRRSLWELEFQAEVFKKPRGQKSKGVDITLARDMLSHAYQDHYDIALLVAGDGDYVPLVDAVKRTGKVVALSFFADPGLNETLKLAADDFFDLSQVHGTLARSLACLDILRVLGQNLGQIPLTNGAQHCPTVERRKRVTMRPGRTEPPSD